MSKVAKRARLAQPSDWSMLPSPLNQGSAIAPPSSLQSALQMEANQPNVASGSGSSPSNGGGKRRRKAEGAGAGDDGGTATEPRRLRRSHEACARCRSKKIKCDSKHPRCTACATAGLPCQQEDRHRQTLTPRGYTERIELQLGQCEALLKRQFPGFTLETLEDVLLREGINPESVQPIGPSTNFQYENNSVRPFRPDSAGGGPVQPQQPPKVFPVPMYPPGPHVMHPPPYPPHPMMPYGPAPPYHPQMAMQGPPGAYNPHIHPAFQHPYGPPPVMGQPPPEQQQQQQQPSTSVPQTLPIAKGVDPNGNDMSNAEALAKNFGVSDVITSGLKLDAGPDEIPVPPSARPNAEPNPRNAAQWIVITLNRDRNQTSNTLSLHGPVSNSPTVDIWLPKDRKMTMYIIDVYFIRLNIHRPVFARKDFDKIVNDLYNRTTQFHDPGHLCSLYLILALGTLSELNHRAVKGDISKEESVQQLGSSVAKKLLPDWPEHTEFFERALIVKPDLRVAIQSLQSLILLHWYLYIERQGRTLWRLVGVLVRLGVELGLHHDPTIQFNAETGAPTFSEEEAQQRIRLWGIILIHDRGTSILLGRPLAISASDTNTPHPTRAKNYPFADISEHFELSHPVVDIQADIINSLYTPTRQAGDTIMRNATRIIKSMSEFRRGMPDRYKYYFHGTDEWPTQKRVELVHKITEDEGLTLLKIGIARILMLRALFSSKELNYTQKHKALVDAIITSHNVIIIHSQLIKFPDIAFFTSPIPLHIAAMVILYGHISKVDCLPSNIALEDVFLALDMLPRFRWRWERKDNGGGHPLISRLVEQIMNVSLHTVHPKGTQLLMSEPDWEEPTSPVPKSQHTTPILSTSAVYSAAAGTTGPAMYGPQPRSLNGIGSSVMNRSHSGGSTPPDKHLADVPTGIFYPFFPEAGVNVISNVPNPNSAGSTSSASSSGGHHADYSQMLRAAAATQDGYDTQTSNQDAYMSDVTTQQAQPNSPVVWVQPQAPRTIPSYPVQHPPQ